MDHPFWEMTVLSRGGPRVGRDSVGGSKYADPEMAEKSSLLERRRLEAVTVASQDDG